MAPQARPLSQVEISDLETLLNNKVLLAVSPLLFIAVSPREPNTWNVDKIPLVLTMVFFL